VHSSVTYHFPFAAVHDAPFLPVCSARLHGHRWDVSVTVGLGPDPATGRIVVPVSVFERVVAELADENLNDLLPAAVYPTPENLASYIMERIRLETPGIEAVTVEMDDLLSATVSV
jgi:6-pyruvoyl-tetrahydropterin synthase